MREREKDTSQPRYTLSWLHSSWTALGSALPEKEREGAVCPWSGVKGWVYKSGVENWRETERERVNGKRRRREEKDVLIQVVPLELWSQSVGQFIHLRLDHGSELCRGRKKERKKVIVLLLLDGLYIVLLEVKISSPSTPILPSPSESPALRNVFVSASVRALALAEKFCRNSLERVIRDKRWAFFYF